MKKIIIITILILIIGGGASYFLFFKKDAGPKYETVKAETMNLTQTVQETGKVKANKEISLSFEQGGKLKKNWINVNEQITATQTLMELDHEYLEIQKQEALASLKAAEAKLKKLKAGEQEEDIRGVEKQASQAEEEYNSSLKNLTEIKKTTENTVKQAKKTLNNLLDDSADTLTNYEQSIQTAKDSLEKTKKSYQQSINKNKELALSNVFYSLSVINTALDEIDEIINDEDLKRLSVLGVKNPNHLTQTEILYEESLVLKTKANQNYIKVNQDNSKENVQEAVLSTLNALNKTMDALNYCYKTLENSVTTSSFTSTILNTHKTTINSQITNVNTNIGSIQSIKHSLESAYISYDLNINSAENNLKQAQVNLDDAIRSAENALESAQINGE